MEAPVAANARLVGIASPPARDDPRALGPLDLMLAAVRSAGADALAASATLLAGVGRIGVPKGRWRYQNPGGEIARAIGADRAVSLLASVGVLQQTLIGDACRAIAEGETDTTLVSGRRGLPHLRSSIRRPGEERQQDDEPHVSLSPKDELRHPAELRRMKMPVVCTRFMESAYRARNGWSIDGHRDRLAQMYSRFSEIAAENLRVEPERSPRDDPQRLERNPMQGFPYTKPIARLDGDQGGHCCARNSAPTSSALRTTAHLSAREHESNHMAAGVDPCELRRVSRGALPGRAALDAGELSIAPRPRRALHVLSGRGRNLRRRASPALNARPHRPGSMAFAGGPQYYVLQATAAGTAVAEAMGPNKGRHGLVSSVGCPDQTGLRPWSRERDARLRATASVRRGGARDRDRAIVDSAGGRAAIAGYTVLYERGKPPRGVAVVDVDAVVLSCNRDPAGRANGIGRAGADARPSCRKSLLHAVIAFPSDRNDLFADIRSISSCEYPRRATRPRFGCRAWRALRSPGRCRRCARRRRRP